MVETARPQAWRFGHARLDERTLELHVDGALIALERKPLQVLRVLLRRAGDVVSHDDLLGAVWPGRAPSHSVLKKCVSQLREALHDDDQSIVKTVHGFGYRLVARVEAEALQPSVVLSPGLRAAGSPPLRCGAVLRLDVAGTVDLRNQSGDAAASARVRALVDAIVKLARERHAAFIQSYGDDVLAVFGDADAAASVAIEAHRAADRAGFELYSGLHVGDVAFQEYLGQPEAAGPTVDFANRLHKLTDGVPGHLFLSDAAETALGVPMRTRATPYGARELKGIGAVTLWTLEWRDAASLSGTLFVDGAPEAATPTTWLVLHHAGQSLRVQDGGKPFFIGRDKACGLRVPDPQPRVSTKHVMIERSGGHWILQDTSRNGTWLRDDRTGEILQLPYCVKTMIPRSGALCLGRVFADDPGGLYTVRFELG